MIRGRRLLVGITATLALHPALAHAQLETFTQVVKELADASRQAEPARSSRTRAAAGRIKTALTEWDRRIDALAARVGRELPGASPEHAYQLHVELGVAYRSRGRRSDALREFDAAVELRPSSDVQVLRALTLEAGNSRNQAARAFQEAWRLDAGNPIKAYYVAQRGSTSRADRDRARDILADTYRNMKLEAGGSPPFVVLGVIPDNLSQTPVVGDGTTALGFALLRDEKYSEAVEALGRSVSPREQPEYSPLAQFARGQRDEAAARVADARREYRAALAGTLAGRSPLLVAIARLSQVEGDSASALDAFAEAARLNPNDSNVRKELAAAYAADGRTDEAFCELMAALLINARDAQAHASIGQLYLDSGRDNEAVTAFGRALELRPEGYEVRYALATAHTRLGHPDEAARQLEIYDRLRREALEQRRRAIEREVEEEERNRRR